MKKRTSTSKKRPSQKNQIRSKTRARRDGERRRFRRVPVTTLWVTEYAGDYRFVARAADLSPGGVFLTGRVLTSSTPSRLVIPTGTARPIELNARPVHERFQAVQGTGYAFVELTPTQQAALQHLLRNLD